MAIIYGRFILPSSLTRTALSVENCLFVLSFFFDDVGNASGRGRGHPAAGKSYGRAYRSASMLKLEYGGLQAYKRRNLSSQSLSLGGERG